MGNELAGSDVAAAAPMGRRVTRGHMIGRAVAAILIAAAITAGLYQAGRAAKHGADLWSIVRGDFHATTDEALATVPLRPISDVPVRTLEGQVAPLDPPGGTALLLFYHSTCGACKAGMARWLDLVVEARSRGIPVYALSLDSTAAQLAYWRGGSRDVELRGMVDRLDLEALTGQDGVPATVVVRHDSVVAVVPGTIGARRRAFVLRELSNE